MQALVLLVGHLASDIEIIKNDYEMNIALLKVIVERPFKNAEGIYEKDIFNVQSWGNVSDQLQEIAHKGSLVGIRGRLQTKDNNVIIIAEKISILSSSSNKEEK